MPRVRLERVRVEVHARHEPAPREHPVPDVEEARSAQDRVRQDDRHPSAGLQELPAPLDKQDLGRGRRLERVGRLHEPAVRLLPERGRARTEPASSGVLDRELWPRTAGSSRSRRSGRGRAAPRSVALSTPSAFASFDRNSSGSRRAGWSRAGRRRKTLPDPSLFMTMFILVALTRSGLMSNPKKHSPATSFTRSRSAASKLSPRSSPSVGLQVLDHPVHARSPGTRPSRTSGPGSSRPPGGRASGPPSAARCGA